MASKLLHLLIDRAIFVNICPALDHGRGVIKALQTSVEALQTSIMVLLAKIVSNVI